MKIRIAHVIFFLTLCAKFSYAEAQTNVSAPQAKSRNLFSPYDEDGNVADAKTLLQEMAGVYKRRFENGDTFGDTYMTEDVFEFVPVSDSAAYLNMRLNFFNGHQCSIAGIAEYKKIGGFVYQGTESDNADKCLLTIKLKGDQIDFEDPNGNCRSFCGARGGVDGEGFKLSQRRVIKYMPIIQRSTAYVSAMKKYEERHGKEIVPTEPRPTPAR
jgi:hypothetical protein